MKWLQNDLFNSDALNERLMATVRGGAVKETYIMTWVVGGHWYIDAIYEDHPVQPI